ncbi:aldehyde oxidase GLOX [Rutidosis leptorrhynchoides]|uniref:aldehyde oxidase GLOX n=1 Tax=Rutidosis leptorrhynchoides TaxID=125765 RepID=UPI003A9960DC
MHMQLLHDNKVMIFDRTDFGRSNISLPDGRCRDDSLDTILKIDCTAHSVVYDIKSNGIRPLMVQTDTWCSSGALLPDGTLVQTGGFNDGERVVRTFTPCDDSEGCDWVEFPQFLSRRRWYASNQILPDGRIIIVGGRRQFDYEFYPKNGFGSDDQLFSLDFLRWTRDNTNENNLYPFLHLLPDGTLFIFANTRSILLDYNQNHVLKEFPPIPDDDPRNYPSSGSSVLLPLDESNIDPEIMVCGGAPRSAYERASHGTFIRAITTCGRLKVSEQYPSWVMEQMPIPRVMGDMIILPTGDVIIINGAELGTAGWEFGRAPVIRPVIYRPSEQNDWRFSTMASSNRPRLYHSSAILLPDGRILIGGSNPHIYYNFTNVEYPTDLSLETFSPPYLSSEYLPVRPTILSAGENLSYNKPFSVRFLVQEYLTERVMSIRMVTPSFTTYAFSMNQRMVVLRMSSVSRAMSDMYDVDVLAPSTPEIAPPGYYMLFVVHANVPSAGAWVKIS